MEEAPQMLIPMLRAAQAGSSTALGELMHRVLPELQAYVRLNSGEALRRRESLSDLVQTVCREMVEDLDGFAGEADGQFKRWLFSVALRKIQSKGRFHAAQRRDARRLEPLPDPSASVHSVYQEFCTPSRAAVVHEEVEQVESAFDELSADYREVVNLCCVMGLSSAEAAAEMGRSEAAIRKLLSRARAQLAFLIARGRDQEIGRS